jgi:hypothetical protein
MSLAKAHMECMMGVGFQLALNSTRALSMILRLIKSSMLIGIATAIAPYNEQLTAPKLYEFH